MDINPENRQTVTVENISYVAEWCGGKVCDPDGRPYLMVKTGFADDPNYRVMVGIGDVIEKTEDGKFQVWVVDQNVAQDEEPSPELKVGRRVRITQEHHPRFLSVGKIDGIENPAGVSAPEARVVQIKLDNGDYTAAFPAELTVLSEQGREDRPEMLKDGDFNPQARAIALVATIFYGEASRIKLDVSDVYIVWFCNTLQNWKALVSTNAKDDAYYEVTYNGDKKETYVDAYHKHVNVKVDDETGVCTMTTMDRFIF